MAVNKYEEFFNLSPDLLCIANTEGNFVEVNAAFEQTLGWTEEELLRSPFIDFIHPDDVDATLAELEQLAAGIPTLAFKNRYRCRDGSYRHLHWTAHPQPETGRLFAVARDMTDLQEAAVRFRTAIDASPSAIIMVDAQGIMQLVNQEAERLFGYEPNGLLGQSIEILVPARFQAGHMRSRATFFKGTDRRKMGEDRRLVAVHENGYEIPVEIGLNPIELENGPHVIASIVDMTRQIELENQLTEAAAELQGANELLERLVITDELTSLLNRRGFNAELQKHIRLLHRLQSPLSLMLLDLDHFKEVNDKHGHTAGDQTLREFSYLLLENLRASDHAARFGGDEFAIILPNTDEAGTIRLAEKIRQEVQDHSWFDRKLTISVGASTRLFSNGNGARDVDVQALLIAEADKALYHSKESGRNQITHIQDRMIVQE